MPDPARIVTPGPPPGGPLVAQPAAILALSARCQGVSSRVWECRSGWRVPPAGARGMLRFSLPSMVAR
jgi:hypothetical protein